MSGEKEKTGKYNDIHMPYQNNLARATADFCFQNKPINSDDTDKCYQISAISYFDTTNHCYKEEENFLPLFKIHRRYT